MFTFGTRSRQELRGVHPKVVAFAERTLAISPQDFAVHDGLRTLAEQHEYVKTGVSQTMDSKHLPQADGYGWALDLVPVINGKLRWEWEPIYVIADAARVAAKELGVRVRWGGAWTILNDVADHPRVLVEQYVARKKAAGKKAFTDGPHFEMVA